MITVWMALTKMTGAVYDVCTMKTITSNDRMDALTLQDDRAILDVRNTDEFKRRALMALDALVGAASGERMCADEIKAECLLRQ